jgi:Na+/H+ antiporter NhaD/arsenite permease-like protein
MQPPILAALSTSGEMLRSTTDPVSQGLVALIIIGVFVLLTLEYAHRVLVIFGAVALIWSITYFTPWKLIGFDATKEAVDLNVLFLLAGMMAVVGVLKTTGVFPWAVAKLLQRSGGRPALIQRLVSGFTGLLSAFLDNVTTVIFVTPMAGEMAARTRVRPVVYLLPMVMASNIGGTATLIGDPPNVMIGSGAHLEFVDFIRNLTLPVLFMMVVLDWYARRYFRDDLTVEQVATEVETPSITDPRLLRWALVILAGIFVGFFTHGMTGMPVAAPAVIGAATMLIVQDVLYMRRVRPGHSERRHGLLDIVEREIEWPTLSFFAFLFIAVGAAVQTGLIDTMANGLIWVVGTGSSSLGLSPNGTLLFAAIIICWVSGVLSALIDNIPYVAVTIPLVARLVADLPGDASVLWWALAMGACLGGNGTAIGASANVTTIGLAEKRGIRIGFAEFTAFGARVTAITLTIASVFLASHIYLGADQTLVWGLVALAALVGGGMLVRRARGATA